MSRELSSRASNFLDSCVRTDAWEGPIRREMIAVDPGLAEVGDGTEEASSRMVFFDEHYGGRNIPVSGGVLAGSLALGCGTRPTLLRSTGDGLMFRMARHDSAQCAIMMSASGQVGSSWSSEFHPLFDSMEHLIEDSAAWHQIRGWHYVAISDFIPSRIVAIIGDVSLDATASGENAKWWLSSKVAIVVHQYLNPGRRSKQVAILAADELEKVRVEQALEAEGIGDQGSIAASLWGIVK
ncbi:hypothetical protein [Streptomyces violascens]|uniref:Uncharacterized protein n=1 Tax=Streptomyces violascens TaxID=67381 RepID=A0ABQ3QTE1_9ACTN|nr:hypothetical protein [Streptomyces violascens]GHI40540.1 hypothetical protein Sviol_49480 [Streptomyces violascens]